MDPDLNKGNEFYKPPTQQVLIVIGINSSGCVLGTLANALVIVVILSIVHLRKSKHFILVSLSGADLMNCLLWQPILMENILIRFRPDFIESFCTFFASLSSLNNVVCLTAERFMAVNYPFHYLTWINARRVMFICVLAYLGSFIFACLIATEAIPIRAIHIYTVVVTVVIMIIYLNIYLTAMKQVQNIKALRIKSTNVQQISKAIKEKSTTVSVGIIVAAFIVCWLPYLMLPAIPRRSFNQFYSWFGTFALLQSNINPLLYFWKFATFRREAKRFLQKWKTWMEELVLQ